MVDDPEGRKGKEGQGLRGSNQRKSNLRFGEQLPLSDSVFFFAVKTRATFDVAR